MAETTFLNTNAIQRNATVGATPPHGPVKTGALPNVQVRPVPAAPPMQQGQQRPVQILAPNAKGAAVAGALPVIQVKQSQNGPQPDDGQGRPVVVKDNKYGFVATGQLPTTQVHQTAAGRQVQTLPTVQGGPPRIPAPAPALSPPRGAGRAVMHVPAPGARMSATAVVALPPMPELSMDQLMFCRFLVDKALGDLRAMASPAVEDAENPEANSTIADNIKLAESTIEAIDQMTVSAAVRAEAEARAAEAEAQADVEAEAEAQVQLPAQVMQMPVRTLPMQRVMSSQSIAPAPKASYVAGPATGAQRGYPVSQAQRNAGMAPRRVPRSGPLPQVVVSMNGGKPAVQNQAEYAATRAEVLGNAAPQRGPLPPVIVNMNGGKPAVQNMDVVQAARAAAAAAPPPQQIEYAAPEGSTPE